MIRLKAILNSQWFFPALMLYYGMFYISFGESYPFHEGLHTDGWVFASFIPDFTKSFFFDTYYVYRILPSFLVGVCLKLLSIDTSVHHIFIGFRILNIVSIVLSCYFFKRI